MVEYKLEDFKKWLEEDPNRRGMNFNYEPPSLLSEKVYNKRLKNKEFQEMLMDDQKRKEEKKECQELGLFNKLILIETFETWKALVDQEEEQKKKKKHAKKL